MTTWIELDLANLSEEAERVPEGNYVFSVLGGAKYNQFEKQKIEVGAKITEGEFKGRVTYFAFPDPEKQAWSPQAFKKFERALVKNGAPEIQEGQDPVSYLNDSEVVGKQFIGPIKHREYVKQDGETKQITEIKLFGVKAIPAQESVDA